MTITPPPTQAGFLEFIRNYMQIPAEVLPDNSVFVADSFQMAKALCYDLLNCISPVQYTQAIYNLGGATLIQTAQDPQPPEPYLKWRDQELPYFEYFRAKFGINSFVGGTIASTSDESTSESLNVPESLKNLTLMDLMLLNTPWGRQYLAIVQQLGYVWGVS